MTCPQPKQKKWKLPLGANVVPDGVRFQVWAPKAQRVEVYVPDQLLRQTHALSRETDGTFSGIVPGIKAGARYKYRLDGNLFPDPWSRSQPVGVHGPSEVVDPESFPWSDAGWTGVEASRLVIYELHVGTFSQDGTFDAIVPELRELRQLGVTAIELMPVAEFPGHRNWGYDGVDLFAPSRNYGGVSGLKRLVDAAHGAGVAVILDVVPNHFGPDGNYLRSFSDSYFTDRYQTPWGEAINVEAPDGGRSRELLVQNACYWLVEYHLDGLRLDATHEINDNSCEHILTEIASTAREAVGDGRRVHIVAEDARNDVNLVRPRQNGGLGLDAIWADDFHHAMHVLLTGENEGYYVDYDGSASSIAATIESGFLYQGEYSAYRRASKGALVGSTPATQLIYCLQNHDQVGNRARGERLNTLIDNADFAAATVLFLLAPEIPLIFMGQEFASTSPFLYFTDHEPNLGRLVSEGRRSEFAQFSAFGELVARSSIPDPQALETFEQSRLDFSERQTHRGTYLLYQHLLELRRDDLVFQDLSRERTEAQSLGSRGVVLRRWSEDGTAQRIVIANFGDRRVLPISSSLSLAWLDRPGWRQRLWSNAPKYGAGSAAPRKFRRNAEKMLELPAHGAVVYAWHSD